VRVAGVVEATLGLEHGFWGLLAKGATFKSVPGRRRTQPGQELIRAHREELAGVERLVNARVTAWRMGAVTPAAPALESMLARWRALRDGEELRLVWRTKPTVARRTAGVPSGSPPVRR
jgi:hypothetical protein